MGKMGRDFETTTASKFRDNSSDRLKLFATGKVKAYQEKSHFNLGGESYPKMTTTWTHFSKRYLKSPGGNNGLTIKV